MERTKVMGILNVTPDSFSDGGLYNTPQRALKRVGEMIEEGADIIDIGGESTRPGSVQISVKEELKRVLPVLIAVRKNFGDSLQISIDTYKAGVAEECLKAGANVINSLGGFTLDNDLARVVAKYAIPVILYHIKGKPQTMQEGKIVYEDVIYETEKFFKEQLDFGIKQGIEKNKFILDPGIGFGKTLENNLEIIKRFEEFNKFGLSLMVGASRKSHLGIILKEALSLQEIPGPEERIEAGLAEVGVAVLKGADIIRTHDVLPTKKFLAVLDRLK